jgi:hypothetical protein
MATVLEETALATRSEQSYELAPTAGAAEKQFEIQSAIIIARRFPRNEDQAFARLMKAAMRHSFADEASYSFKRGKKKDEATGRWVDNFVEGPSVNLAREAARVWGNIRYGLEVIRDDEETRQVRGWAWDLESNVKVTAEDDFKKLVQRKQYDGNGKATGTAWVTADERDLRELTNRRGAILIRNCILQILPSDLIDEAGRKCDETLKNKAAADPDGERKKIILAFSGLNITPEMLEQKLGHKLAECSPTEIAELRKIYKSIADGNSTWAEYVEPKKSEPEKGGLDMSNLQPKNEGGNQQQPPASSSAPASSTPAASIAAPAPAAQETKSRQTSRGKTSEPPAPSQAKGNPEYAETEPDPFGPGGELFKK